MEVNIVHIIFIEIKIKFLNAFSNFYSFKSNNLFKLYFIKFLPSCIYIHSINILRMIKFHVKNFGI